MEEKEELHKAIARHDLKEGFGSVCVSLSMSILESRKGEKGMGC